MILFAANLVFIHEALPKIRMQSLRMGMTLVNIFVFISSFLTLVMFFTWKNEHYMAETPLGAYIAKLRDLLK